MAVDNVYRPRRTCLSVPGSSAKMIEKAKRLPADEVFLGLDVNAIDGPYLKVRDVEAFRRIAGRSAALGYDGKWVLHPDQIEAGNEVFSPRQDDYDRAELILEAYEWHTSAAGGARGAVMLGDEMLDEASRKMAW
jgi:citrate lyase beta subunit